MPLRRSESDSNKQTSKRNIARGRTSLAGVDLREIWPRSAGRNRPSDCEPRLQERGRRVNRARAGQPNGQTVSHSEGAGAEEGTMAKAYTLATYRVAPGK